MLLDASGWMRARNTLCVMSDDRAASELPRRVTPLKIAGWVAYLVAIVLVVVFIVESIGGTIPKSQQLYPLPGVAAVFLVLGIWSVLATVLWKSRSTATRVGKYILAVLVTIIVYPLLVTIVSDLALWVVTLDPNRVH
jgi:4-amino-4-deoxy-L-arabinose transferase-like glycosyltransferase